MIEYKVHQIKRSKAGDNKSPGVGKKIGTYECKTMPAINSTIEVNGSDKRVCFIEILDSEEKRIIVDDLKKGD